jgi:hypothetical protein
VGWHATTFAHSCIVWLISILWIEPRWPATKGWYEDVHVLGCPLRRMERLEQTIPHAVISGPHIVSAGKNDCFGQQNYRQKASEREGTHMAIWLQHARTFCCKWSFLVCSMAAKRSRGRVGKCSSRLTACPAKRLSRKLSTVLPTALHVLSSLPL